MCIRDRSEIAQEAGISRQGVHDLIKRCDKTLEDYESRLHLMEKFRIITEKLEEIKQLTPDEKIRKLADEILAEM